MNVLSASSSSSVSLSCVVPLSPVLRFSPSPEKEGMKLSLLLFLLLVPRESVLFPRPLSCC